MYFLINPIKLLFISALYVNGNENVYLTCYFFIIFISGLLFMHLIPSHLPVFHNSLIILIIQVPTPSGCLVSTIQHLR